VTLLSADPPSPPICVLGSDSQAGSYVLRIRVREDLCLPFGRFKHGKLIEVPAGEYAYVGSALAERGGVSLARRLVRHATRTGTQAPHPIRDEMLVLFPSLGLGEGRLLPRNGKHLFWNIDHLLDREEAELIGACLLRSPRRLERELGQLLEHDPNTEVIEKGLGANDVPGNTHILRVHADESWWRALPQKLLPLL
jgi:Uri superfamily endonuclease